MALAFINTNPVSMGVSYSDNAMADSANASDKAQISGLKAENKTLQDKVIELQAENGSLETQIAQFKSAVQVDISSDTKSVSTETRELSDITKQVLATNNVNIANDSKNFSSQTLLSQAGSLAVAQSTNVTSSASQLVNRE